MCNSSHMIHAVSPGVKRNLRVNDRSTSRSVVNASPVEGLSCGGRAEQPSTAGTCEGSRLRLIRFLLMLGNHARYKLPREAKGTSGVCHRGTLFDRSRK